MVSIPDWARFAQLTESKQQNTQSLLSKFYKQREAEAVKQAEESGYFLNPTEDVLLSLCGAQNSQKKSIADFQLVCLPGVHLRVLRDIGACSKLTICLLANNFLSKVDALIACRHLIKLDLHSNQLTSIPSVTFWRNLHKLQALHLHDNPLGKFETLQILGSSPGLSILTLYDTPLSLKKNYRHHVVNSIWTLKALDSHVISDEEIIEDAIFTGHFTALNPCFRIELCPQYRNPADSTFQSEMALFRSVVANVNSILARNSPVLIVQRFLRGYLVRRRLGVPSSKMSTMTPGYRLFPPPATPIVLSDQVQTTIAGEAVDYDTYMKNRRPGSIAPEEAMKAMQQTHEQTYQSQGQEIRPSKSQESQRLHVNLEKLESGTLSGLHADTVAIEAAMAEREGQAATPTSRREKWKKKERKDDRKDDKPKLKRIKDIKQFFGPMVPTFITEGDDENEDEIPLTDYRLKGKKPKVLVADATTEMILSRREAGQMVREAEEERVKQEAMKPMIKAPLYNFSNNEQRLFNRSQGTMGLSCLMAVQKAYKEREKAEQAAVKMENILGMREERQRAKDRINMYHDERRAQVLKSRDLDRARIIDRMEKRELQRLNFLDKQQEHKIRSSDVNKVFKADHSFMLEFNSQHTSVSNALLRHDRQARGEDGKATRQRQVSNAKLNETEQQDTVKKYMEHRKLMRQTETAMAKAALDTKMLTEANDRMMEARNRVAHQKARQASVQAFYPLPPNTMPPASTAPAGMTRWEAASSVSAGRVGRHNTLYV